MWEDVEGQENFPVSAGFELTTHGLLVQEHNYSATTHSPLNTCGHGIGCGLVIATHTGSNFNF